MCLLPPPSHSYTIREQTGSFAANITFIFQRDSFRGTDHIPYYGNYVSLITREMSRPFLLRKIDTITLLYLAVG
jgi:hypothetical protein